MCLTSRLPCLPARSPLVAPDVRISRIRRSQIPEPHACARSCAAWTLQVDQAQFPQVLIPGLPYRRTVGPLAPSLQVSDQPTAYVTVDRPECLPGVAQPEVVRPAFQVSVQVPDQHRQRL